MTEVQTTTRLSEPGIRTEVIDVPRERLDEAAGVLARAFADYPVIRYIFPRGAAAAPHVNEAFRFLCAARLANGEPMRGVLRDGRLLAVACIDSPDAKPWPEDLERAFEEFAKRAGDQVLERFERYGELNARHRPKGPHFYLAALGVLPKAQGQGLGRLLLDDLHAMSSSDPVSTGVGLDTETTANVALYRHCGYVVVAEDSLEEVPVWSMFRPDDADRSTV